MASLDLPKKPLTGAELTAAAMKKHALSVRALARRLGLSGPTVLNWRDGRAIPTDNHALTLAALLGLDPCAVLIGLNLERTDCPDGRSAWRQMFTEHCRAMSETWEGIERRAK